MLFVLDAICRRLPSIRTLASLMAMPLAAAALPASAASPRLELRCEGDVSPTTIDVATPQLSWTFSDDAQLPRGTMQSACRVLVASSLEKLARDEGDLWDSGRLETSQSAGLAYAGSPLRSGQQAFWKVRLWTAAGLDTAWSAPAHWTMGLLSSEDWQPAQWIGRPSTSPPPTTRPGVRSKGRVPAQPASLVLRKSFALKPAVARATIFITGLGHYELAINGNEVGDHLLAPGWTDYRKTILYDAFDVTDQLRAGGENAIAIMLGNGMYHIEPTTGRYVKFTNTFGEQKAIAQLRIDYADGSSERIGTDESWQTFDGPITYTNQFGGEDYDARLAPRGWHEPTQSPQKAAIVESPGGKLSGHSVAAPPIKAIEAITPVAVTQPKPGVTIYDLGQNTALMPRIRLRGPAGSYVRVIPSELLGADGFVDRASCVQDEGGPAWWQWTLAEDNKSTQFFPHFFYQGARYLQVENFPASEGGALPTVESIEGVVVHSSSEAIGTFETSNDLFNRIYRLVRWAQRSNMMSLMTDCPQREKLGWLEELHLNGPSLRYNFRLDRLYAKAMNDMADAQLDVGLIPNIAPEYFIAHKEDLTSSFRNSVEWGSAFVISPLQQLHFTGDDTLLRRYYPQLKRYVDFLTGMAKNDIIEQGLGDWYDLGPKPPWGSQLTPPPFTATAIYYWDLNILADVATKLGKPHDAAAFRARAARVKSAFNARFFDAERKRYATGSQCTSAMPLVLGLCEPENREAVLQVLIDDIRSRGNGLSAGDVGYRFVLRALADAGRSDVIFDMNNQSDRPGYGMQLARGATALTEKWDASVGSFGSQNHFMLGQINEWFFHDLAGIRYDPAKPGFEQLEIKPAIVGDITWLKSSFRSNRGLIRVEWRKTDAGVELDVTVPPNCCATVHVPTGDPKSVTEDGKLVGEVAGVERVGESATFKVGSGTYRFVAR